jgi:hypothetical protein
MGKMWVLWEKCSQVSHRVDQSDIPRISLGILYMRVIFLMVLLQTRNNIITQEDGRMEYLFLKVVLSIFLVDAVLKFQLQLLQPTPYTPKRKQYHSTCIPGIRFLYLD